MASSFWDALTYAAVMSVGDLLKGKDKKVNMRLRANYQEHKEKIGDDSATFIAAVSEMVSGVADKNSNRIIVEGMPVVPTYVFLKVFRLQHTLPSEHQMQMLDLYFKSIHLNFSKQDFLNSVSGNNDTNEYMEKLVGVTNHSLGSFWEKLFEAMCASEKKEGNLSVIIKCIESIMMSFAILGGQDQDKVEMECEEFANVIRRQFDRIVDGFENEVITQSNTDFILHHQHMKKICNELMVEAGDDGEFNINEAFNYFSIGLVYELLKNAELERADKIALLDEIIQLCGIELAETGEDILNEMDDLEGAFYSTVSYLTKITDESQGLWGILFILATKAQRNEAAIEFLNECAGFLMNLQLNWSNRFPFTFKVQASKYMVDILEKMNI